MKKTWKNKLIVSLLCAGMAVSSFSSVQVKAYAADEAG